MTHRIKVTGYFTPDESESEPAETSGGTGLTEEAHVSLIVDEYGTGLKIADLENVELEIVEES